MVELLLKIGLEIIIKHKQNKARSVLYKLYIF